MTTDATHTLSGPATHEHLEHVHDLLERAWHAAPQLSASERARFTLIVAELIANVIEHGAAGRSEPPQLDLTLVIRDDAIHGTLTDDGAPPPHDAASAHGRIRTAAEVSRSDPPDPAHLEALREAGRGLHIVRSVADDLALTRTDARNHWRFVVRPRRTR